jgi:hypothetical protein
MTLLEVANKLSTKVELCPSFFQIHRLCVSLIDLYTVYTSRVKSRRQVEDSYETMMPFALEEASPNNGQAPRRYPSFSSPVRVKYPYDSKCLRPTFSVPPPLDPIEDPINNLLPWDQTYFEQQINWDLL